ncbi:MAG: mechanosensitive ion channel, partial [Lutibacter sp.]|nr:mechanosensitive ion channel [Lutibacter sp.]
QSKKTRFKINIGVAYESDLDLVVKVLKESAWEHPEVSEKELIAVRFLDFGPSSLQFQVIFFSENIFRIERVKSDIRMVINRKFNEHKISIPFPQMDVYVKSNLK